MLTRWMSMSRMSRVRDIEIFLKLPSVPALVTLTLRGDASDVVSRLVADGYRARRVGTEMIVVEE